VSLHCDWRQTYGQGPGTWGLPLGFLMTTVGPRHTGRSTDRTGAEGLSHKTDVVLAGATTGGGNSQAPQDSPGPLHEHIRG